MVQVEYLALILTGIGIIVSILYYASVLRNANKTQQMQLETRQAQLFMQLYDTWRSPTFRDAWNKMRVREWEDVEDWQSKYSPLENPEEGTIMQTVFMFYDGVGVLVRRNLVDISMVNELFGRNILMTWEQFEAIIEQVRVRSGNHWMYKHTESLYKDVMKYREEHPELKT